jgi:hypothetical protein
MSTYLLLRNNKETGPFTLDELKRMSLKAYDLVWIKGKSAAWRYPGEISEFSSFAPAAPEQPFDRFYKKAVPESAAPAVNIHRPEAASNEASTQAPESGKDKSELFIFPARPREENNFQHLTGNNNRNGGSNSVYIHLPATENKGTGFIPSRRIQEAGNPVQEISTDFGYPQKNHLAKRSGKTWLVGAVIMMFCAGLFVGFYISNRRNFYSFAGNSSRVGVIRGKSAETPAPVRPDLVRSGENNRQQANSVSNSSRSNQPKVSKPRKKSPIPASGRTDSLQTAAPAATAPGGIDSSRRKPAVENKNNALAAKIRAHPEEYLLIGVGNYKIGVLGGISEVPFTLTNRSGADMDLVVIAVDYWLRNKKIFKTENLSFHQVAAGAVVTANAPKSTRGLKISYRLTIANAQQLGMSYSSL